MYTRQFDIHAQDSLAKLSRWVKPGSRVLELGPAVGYFTRHLQDKGCVIDVVEIDAQAAGAAGLFARTVVVGDLSDAATLGPIAHCQYDAIVCADVLEHIVDGARLLQRLRPLLAPDGSLLLSVPNVAHSAVIAGLLDEAFEYSREGLLDASHVHLYTRRSLDRLLREAGFRIDEWDAVLIELHASEFRTRLERFRPEVADCLLARPNALVYQWLLRAGTGDAAESAAAPALGAVETVPLRILHADSAAELTLDRAVRMSLPSGETPIVVEAGIPQPVGALRILLADRVGIIELGDIELLADGQVLWSLAREDACRTSGTVLRLDAQRWALADADAYLEPVVDPQLLRTVDRVRITAAWPLAQNEAAAFATFEAMAHALTLSRQTAGREIDLLRTAISESDEQLQATQHRLAEAEAMRAELDSVGAELDSVGAEFAAARDAWRRQDAEHRSLRWWLRLPWLRRRPAKPDR